ncbi:collagen, type I, alpha 1a [Pan troglodytes]|uniref:collagen, type I, alpha 1a n=1 Tax=Pan troglodytes TaxID=9598 RepID=UPI0030134E6B
MAPTLRARARPGAAARRGRRGRPGGGGGGGRGGGAGKDRRSRQPAAARLVGPGLAGGSAWDTARRWPAWRGGGALGGDWAEEGSLCAVLQPFCARGRGTAQGAPSREAHTLPPRGRSSPRRIRWKLSEKPRGSSASSLLATWSRGAASALGCPRPASGLASSRGPPGFPSAPLRGSPCAPDSGSGTGLPRGCWFRKGVRAPPSGLGSHFAFCSCWTKPNTVADRSGDSWHGPWRGGLKRLLALCRSLQRLWT